ncbi:hypothetical protein GCM10025859_65390 [Alicyclobacillus fastidiosus]|nr:hypothetical protein GCM10025859_65390 [Alicyclobacillus fastidiosus]
MTVNAPKVKRKELNSHPKLSFSVISDIHLRTGKSDWGTNYHDAIAARKLKNALTDLDNINPHEDALVINGDFTTTGVQSDYDTLKDILNTAPHPKNILYAMGNHEFSSAFHNRKGVFSPQTFPNGVTVHSCIELFKKNTGMSNSYYDRWLNGYHFIVLGAEYSMSDFRKHNDTVLSETQLQWLAKKLQKSPNNKPTFVFLHEPIPNTVAGSFGGYLINGDKLRKILNQYPSVLFFSGHTHYSLMDQPSSIYHDYFTMFNTSAVRNPIIESHKLLGNSEGLYVQVYDHSVTVSARDFTIKSWIWEYTVRTE